MLKDCRDAVDQNPKDTAQVVAQVVEGELPARWRRGSSERDAAACMLKRIRAGLDRRTRKIRRTKAAIRVGVYENDLKLHIAMDRLLADMMV
jgi:hypothetical protein